MIIIRKPNKNELKQMYNLRWKINRKPFGLPKGSEIDNKEKNAKLVIAYENSLEQIIGSARMTLEKETCQISFVGVKEEFRKMKVGEKMMNYLHDLAKDNKYTKIYLYARKTAESFYHKLGYKSIGEYFKTKKYNIDQIKMEINF